MNTHLPRLLRSSSNTNTNINTNNTTDPTKPLPTRSRFGFTPSTTVQPKNVDNPSQTTRPASALGGPIARPSSAMGRPSTALGTRSQTNSNTRLPQSTTIPVPAPNRKRRTSSTSSRRPARPSSHLNPDPTLAPDTILLSDLKNQLTEALEKLSSVQEECNRFKLLSEEATLRADLLRTDQDDLRASFYQEINRTQEEHRQQVEQIQKDLGDQLRRSQEEIHSIQSSNATRLEELKQATEQVSHLHSEIEQMDMDSGQNAAQVIELTRLKTELESKLEATQTELGEAKRENENRIEQVTKHYHNIQSKLHQDLEQITADYQACLQQQSLNSSSEKVVEQLNFKVQQLEQKLLHSDTEYQKVKSELDHLVHSTARHEEEKQGWDLFRNKLEEEIRNLELQTDMAKRRKITSIKTEDESTRVENQLIDFNTSMGDINQCDTLPDKAQKRSTEFSIQVDQQHCSGDSSLLGFFGQVDDYSTLEIKLENKQLDEPTMTLNKGSISEKNHKSEVGPEKTQVELKDLEVARLKTELQSAHTTIVQLKEERLAAQTLLENDLNSVRNDLETQLLRSRQMDEDLNSNMVDREMHEKTEKDLKNLQSQLVDLTAELDSSRETIRTLDNHVSALKDHHALEIDQLSQVHAQEIQSSSEQILRFKTELDDLKTTQTSSQETILALNAEMDTLKNCHGQELDHLSETTRANEIQSRQVHEREIQSSAEQIFRLKTELDELKVLYAQTSSSSQDTILALSANVDHLKNFQGQGLDRLLETHAKEIQSSTEQIDQLKIALNDVQKLYTETSFELEKLKDFSPERVSVTIERLRQERDEAQNIIEFMQIEQKAMEEASQKALSEVVTKQQNSLNEIASERNSLVVTILMLNRAMQSWKKIIPLAKNQGANLVKKDSEIKSGAMDDSLVDFNQAYATALEQITTLTQQVQDLKEQLTRTYVAHAEQERQTLANLASSQQDNLLLEEQYGQIVKQQTNLISSLELKYLGIQHQFQSLEVSYNSLCNEKLQFTRSSEEHKQVVKTLEEQLVITNSLQQDYLATIERLEQTLRSEESQRKNELDQNKAEVALLKETFEKESKNLSGLLEEKSQIIDQLKDEVCILTYRIEEASREHDQIQGELEGELSELNQTQKSVYEEQLSLKLQVASLEDKLKASQLDMENLLDELKEQKVLKDKALEELGQTKDELVQVTLEKNSIDEKSNLINEQHNSLQLQVAKLQDKFQVSELEIENLRNGLNEQKAFRDEALKELEQTKDELVQVTQARDSINEQFNLINEEQHSHQLQVAQLQDKFQVSELQIENLHNRLNEQKAFKDKAFEELEQTKDELVQVTQARDSINQQFNLINEKFGLLAQELQSIKSQQHVDSDEQLEILSAECQVLKKQFSTVTTELELLRSQYLDVINKKEELTKELEEKDLMIDSLKADLATISKLHNRLSSSTDSSTDKIKDLETRIETKSIEAEDNLDRLLDEMQKNKRLSIMVETLKIKLKSKTKSMISLDQPNATSGEDQTGNKVNSSSSKLTEETESSMNTTRKRKHEMNGQASNLRVEMGVEEEVEDLNTNKENPTLNNKYRSIRRKISSNNSTKPTVLITEPLDHQKDNLNCNASDLESNPHLDILQPISVNQPNSHSQSSNSNPSESISLDLKPSNQKLILPNNNITSVGKTDAHLLASIQSLRRKQQLKHLDSNNSNNNSNSNSNSNNFVSHPSSAS